MTVKELREALEGLPDDKPITVWEFENAEWLDDEEIGVHADVEVNGAHYVGIGPADLAQYRYEG